MEAVSRQIYSEADKQEVETPRRSINRTFVADLGLFLIRR